MAKRNAALAKKVRDADEKALGSALDFQDRLLKQLSKLTESALTDAETGVNLAAKPLEDHFKHWDKVRKDAIGRLGILNAPSEADAQDSSEGRRRFVESLRPGDAASPKKSGAKQG